MRGNPVMKAKRVTGPTPNTVLCMKVAQERCQCGNPVTLSHSSAGGGIVRRCMECIGGKAPVAPSREILAEMWWLRK